MTNSTKNVTVKTELEMLREQVQMLQDQMASLPKARDRGPRSLRSMTDEDAFRVMHGDLKEMKHMKAAKELGLSYGQIYSARGGYTFKHIDAKFKIK